jgi:hypothetical protein
VGRFVRHTATSTVCRSALLEPASLQGLMRVDSSRIPRAFLSTQPVTQDQLHPSLDPWFVLWSISAQEQRKTSCPLVTSRGCNVERFGTASETDRFPHARIVALSRSSCIKTGYRIRSCCYSGCNGCGNIEAPVELCGTGLPTASLKVRLGLWSLQPV